MSGGFAIFSNVLIFHNNTAGESIVWGQQREPWSGAFVCVRLSYWEPQSSSFALLEPVLGISETKANRAKRVILFSFLMDC